jgi:hypothetical protein
MKMKRGMLSWIAVAVVLGLVAWTAPAQERRDGAAEGAVAQPAEKDGDAPSPEARNRVRDREAGAQGEEALLGRQRNRLPSGKALVHAITSPWAKDDAELQSLVDKVLAQQQALLEAQTEQLKLLKKTAAERSTATKDTAAYALLKMESSINDVREIESSLNKDMAALNKRMGELRPPRARPVQRAQEAAPEREGAREGAQE